MCATHGLCITLTSCPPESGAAAPLKAQLKPNSVGFLLQIQISSHFRLSVASSCGNISGLTTTQLMSETGKCKKKSRAAKFFFFFFFFLITAFTCCCITEIALIEAVETLRKAVVDLVLRRGVTAHLDCNTSVLRHAAFIFSVM